MPHTKSVASVTGIDFSERMVEIARATYPHLDIRQGNAEQLPFDGDTFDAVIMNFGMLHLANPRQAMGEAARVLRSDGRFAFTVWATPEYSQGFRLVLDAVAQYGAKVQLPQGPDFFTYADPERARDDLEASGFEDVTTTQVDMTWRLASPGDLYASFFTGTARTGALLRGQDPDAQQRIEHEIDEQVRQLARNGTVEIPMAAVLSCGRKPKSV